MSDDVNLAMLRKVRVGVAIDISNRPRDYDGHYVLEEFVDGKDYCDLKRQLWVCTIGRRKRDRVILASTASDFYRNSDFECLFLR